MTIWEYGKTKQYHRKEQLKSFHLNRRTIEFYPQIQTLETMHGTRFHNGRKGWRRKQPMVLAEVRLCNELNCCLFNLFLCLCMLLAWTCLCFNVNGQIGQPYSCCVSRKRFCQEVVLVVKREAWLKLMQGILSGVQSENKRKLTEGLASLAYFFMFFFSSLQNVLPSP